ncbi:unnamed protein product [Phytophthora lilii]|uniref:Unnamed protein product n=1 Tax=Phytophthora lilii TaxID=2077276 RepID=A0A9W6TIK0_9STRA|nr:unnamed protein product [Phytophthora lilii]
MKLSADTIASGALSICAHRVYRTCVHNVGSGGVDSQFSCIVMTEVVKQKFSSMKLPAMTKPPCNKVKHDPSKEGSVISEPSVFLYPITAHSSGSNNPIITVGIASLPKCMPLLGRQGQIPTTDTASISGIDLAQGDSISGTAMKVAASLPFLGLVLARARRAKRPELSVAPIEQVPKRLP